jgi:hypothetical protein
MRHPFVPLFIFKMQKFSTVKQACELLTVKTGNFWTFRYEMLHGKRFYFVWQTKELPFRNYHPSLVCRGDKDKVLARLVALASAPELPAIA